MRLYLDYSATTPPRAEAIERMQWVLSHAWGNPSSIHWWGERAAEVLEEARCQVAALLGADPMTIVFTSGGTESDNLALLGVAHRYDRPQHLIISSVEHSAIEASAAFLETQGWQVTRLGVDRQGVVSPDTLAAAIQPNTVLVSIIYGQNEVGTLQPIADLAAVARMHGILFHTDAVQLAGRVPLDVEALGVDLLSLSSHKLYGPQGAGALYVRTGVKLAAVQRGGGQEQALRSGTQGVATIAGFGIAAALAVEELGIERQRLESLRDRLRSQLDHKPYLIWTGAKEQRLPHHLSFCIDHPQRKPINGKTIVRQLNLASIGISSGSACSSGQTQPSRILQAMGYSDRLALSSLRISLGKPTRLLDVDWVAQVIPQIVQRAIEMET
jgi:cysteine desulfurase